MLKKTKLLRQELRTYLVVGVTILIGLGSAVGQQNDSYECSALSLTRYMRTESSEQTVPPRSI